MKTSKRLQIVTASVILALSALLYHACNRATSDFDDLCKAQSYGVETGQQWLDVLRDDSAWRVVERGGQWTFEHADAVGQWGGVYPNYATKADAESALHRFRTNQATFFAPK